jgi:phosphatidylethanolamine-binding protein (PEBP) family uncharacterized protein
LTFNGKKSVFQMTSTFAGGAVPARYTCAGSDQSPPLSWGPLPSGAAEVAVFILGFVGVGQHVHVAILWAVAGLNPALAGISAGKLPAGALLGRTNSHSVKYSLCPAKGAAENLVFLTYALPSKLNLKPGFNASKLLGKISVPTSPAVFGAFLAKATRV